MCSSLILAIPIFTHAHTHTHTHTHLLVHRHNSEREREPHRTPDWISGEDIERMFKSAPKEASAVNKGMTVSIVGQVRRLCDFITVFLCSTRLRQNLRPKPIEREREREREKSD